MKKPIEEHSSKQQKTKIDLPWNKVWKQLSEELFENNSSDNRDQANTRKKAKLLDKAFNLLIEKLTRQN